MGKAVCTVCQKPKATLECGLCQDHLCKYCARIMDEDSFSFLAEVPADLSHGVYCTPCFENKVSTALQDYNQTMESAKDILVFYKAHSKETRLVKRVEDPISVADCADERDVILRLAFLAVKSKHNGIIDIEVSAKKVKTGSYQTTTWSGTGIPANVRPEKLIKDKSLWNYPS